MRMAEIPKQLKLVGAGLVVIIVAALLFGLYANYSDGVRAGVPVKFSKKGILFKTNEGQLNVGGLTNSSEGAIPTTWDFSVRGSEDEVLADMERAMTDQKRVKLHYNEKYVQLFWRGDTTYFVDEVEILED
jgi:hypothetical protein